MNSTKWRKIITCILALTLLAGCSVSDSLGITTHSAQDVEIPAADQERFSMLFHDEYVDQFQLDVEKFSQREQALQRGYALVNSEESESLERGKNLFTGFCYSITSRGSTLQYFGELKNNKPDGFGVIYDNSMSYYTYIGNFSKGKFSGYGIQFSDKLNDNGNVDYEMCIRDRHKNEHNQCQPRANTDLFLVFCLFLFVCHEFIPPYPFCAAAYSAAFAKSSFSVYAAHAASTLR